LKKLRWRHKIIAWRIESLLPSYGCIVWLPHAALKYTLYY
jgi:hypothetical protein